MARAENAIVRSNAVAMAPPPPRLPSNLPRQRVLDEDTYVAALTHIIKRDFFPDNDKLRNQLEWLEALQSRDMARIQAVLERIPTVARRTGTTPGRTPLTPARFAGGGASARGDDEGGMIDSVFAAAAATPRSGDHAQDDLHDSAGAAVDTSLPLDAFVTHYTSEDNASFAELHAQDLVRWRDAHPWLFDREEKELRRRLALEAGRDAHRIQQPAHLLESSAHAAAADAHRDPRPARLDSWKYRGRNMLHFSPELQRARDTCGLPSNAEEVVRERQVRLLEAGAGATTAVDAPRQQGADQTAQLLLAGPADEASEREPSPGSRPAADAASVSSGSQLTSRSKRSRLLDTDAPKPPKVIQRTGTRFSAAQIRGMRETDMSGATNEVLDHLVAPHAAAAAAAAAAQERQQYSYMATPVIRPGADASPLMTWGEVASTPLLLDPTLSIGDASGAPNRFRVAGTPLREELALALEADARKKRRTSTGAARGGSGGARAAALAAAARSPAAQLLRARLGAQAQAASGGFDSQLRASYTPTRTGARAGASRGRPTLMVPTPSPLRAPPGPRHAR